MSELANQQPAAAPPIILNSVGNIRVTADWVFTPAGTWPIRDANITSSDQTATTTHTPAWAIVLVIVFIWFFFLSLLFLLAKETRIVGYIAVTVQAGAHSYTEQVPVISAAARADVMNRLTHIQSLIGWARNKPTPEVTA